MISPDLTSGNGRPLFLIRTTGSTAAAAAASCTKALSVTEISRSLRLLNTMTVKQHAPASPKAIPRESAISPDGIPDTSAIPMKAAAIHGIFLLSGFSFSTIGARIMTMIGAM